MRGVGDGGGDGGVGPAALVVGERVPIENDVAAGGEPRDEARAGGVGPRGYGAGGECGSAGCGGRCVAGAPALAGSPGDHPEIARGVGAADVDGAHGGFGCGDGADKRGAVGEGGEVGPVPELRGKAAAGAKEEDDFALRVGAKDVQRVALRDVGGECAGDGGHGMVAAGQVARGEVGEEVSPALWAHDAGHPVGDHVARGVEPGDLAEAGSVGECGEVGDDVVRDGDFDGEVAEGPRAGGGALEDEEAGGGGGRGVEEIVARIDPGLEIAGDGGGARGLLDVGGSPAPPTPPRRADGDDGAAELVDEGDDGLRTANSGEPRRVHGLAVGAEILQGVDGRDDAGGVRAGGSVGGVDEEEVGLARGERGGADGVERIRAGQTRGKEVVAGVVDAETRGEGGVAGSGEGGEAGLGGGEGEEVGVGGDFDNA